MRAHNPEKIVAKLRRAAVPAAARLHCFDEIASTNDWLLAHADAHARACIAEAQTAGRGRRGRAWRAARGGAVLLSLGWRLGGVRPAGLSLLSGLAAVCALRVLGADGIGLKWPNDLIAAGKKLGGVLVELRRDFCVIGVGVNVETPAEPGAAGLQSLGFAIDRDELAAELIIAHCKLLPEFCAHGFARYAARWQELNVHAGRAVTIESARETFRGTVCGVDSDGALLLEQNGARRRVISGEVSLRAEDGARG